MAANSLTAVELVLADGSHVRADREQNTDLFWALRGGGGSFGVVTALEFQLYPIESAYAGMLIWDRNDAEKVLRRWADWAPGAPDEITTSFRILNLPPLPELPEMIRGRQLVVIDGAVLGSDERGAELIAGLRELKPELDTFGRMPASAMVRLHMDPEGPTPVGVRARPCSDALPEAAVDAFLAEVGPGLDAPACWPASCASSAVRCRRPHVEAVRCRARRRRTCCSVSRSPRRRRWVGRVTSTPSATHGGDEPVVQRRAST